MKKNFHGLTAVIIFFILILAIFTRWIGYNNPHNYTFDESLYAQMGLQLNKNPLNYTSKPVYEYCASRGRSLPDYLNMPLFKHPPVYCYLISLLYFILNSSYLSAFLVSLFFATIIIFVTFIIGVQFFNKPLALLASLLVALDPIHWLCSQKIWMETTMSAFIWITILFLMKAIIHKNYRFFIWAGIATGLAILTKYPAFIIFPIGLTLTFIYNRNLFKSKYFWSWPVISLLMFTPWMFWNYKVYGSNFILQIVTAQGEAKGNFYQNFAMIGFVILLILAIVIFLKLYKKRTGHFPVHFSLSKKVVIILISLGLIALFSRPYMIKGLINVFNIKYIPAAGWKIAMFKQEPWNFYIRRLIELSPFYLISIFGIFFLKNIKSKASPLFVAIFWMMLIFILHGNFQCRYILPAVPAFLIISAYTIIWLSKKISQFYNKNQIVYVILSLILVAILAYSFIKTIFVDLQLALPNNICYF